MVTGGFNRVSLFQQAEQGFDKLFNYDRQQSEAFDYHNTMKNGSIFEQLKRQQQEIQSSERKIGINQENLFSINLENRKARNLVFKIDSHIVIKPEKNTIVNPFFSQENNQTSDL